MPPPGLYLQSSILVRSSSFFARWSSCTQELKGLLINEVEWTHRSQETVLLFHLHVMVNLLLWVLMSGELGVLKDELADSPVHL